MITKNNLFITMTSFAFVLTAVLAGNVMAAKPLPKPSIAMETVNEYVETNDLGFTTVVPKQIYDSARHVSLTMWTNGVSFWESENAVDAVFIYIELPGAPEEILYRWVASQSYIDSLLPSHVIGLESENDWILGKTVEFDAVAWRIEIQNQATATNPVNDVIKVSVAATVTYAN